MKTLLHIPLTRKIIVLVSMFIIAHTGMAQWRLSLTTNNLPDDIVYVNSSVGYEVGYNGFLSKTTDGGLSWQALTSNTTAHFHSVYFVSQTEGYAAGDVLLKTIDGGTTWITLDHNVASAGAITSIYFINADTGWYCTYLGKIFKTTNAGKSWTQYYSISTPFYSIWFIDSSTGWVGGGSGVVLKTTDGGATWNTDASFALASAITGIQFISSTHGWISTTNGYVFRTTDGGNSWTYNSSSIAPFLNDIWFISTTIGWVATNTGVHKTTDGGTTWNHVGINENVYDLSFYSTTHGTATLNTAINPYTSNGGSTWTDAAENLHVNTNGYGLHFINATKGWFVGASGMLRTTNNGGNTWTNMSSGVSTLLLSTFFTSATDGWITGAGGVIRKTTDGGSNWAAQTSGVTTTLYHMTFTSSTTGIIVGDQGRILRTTDAGTNWNIMTSGTTDVLRSVFFYPTTTTGWVVGHTGTILKTTDGGVTWTAQTSGTTQNLLSVFFTSLTNGCAIGANGTILKTTNGGTTWVQQPSVTVNHLTSLFFTSANTGWALGYNGTILGTGNGGSTWINYGNFGGGQPINGVFFTSPEKGYAIGNGGLKLEYNVTCTPQAPVEYTFPGGNNICTNSRAKLRAGGTGKLGWYSAASGGTYLGGGSTFTTPVLSSNATYYVQDSVCSPSAIRTAITVTIVANPSLTVSASGNTITASQSSASYQWMNCNSGNPVLLPGKTAQSYTIDATGEYSAIINLNGCIDTTSCTAITFTSVIDLSHTDAITLFPNPAQDKIILSSTDEVFSAKPATIRVIDMLGNIVINKHATISNNNLEIGMLQSGMYVLEIQSEGQYFRKNIIKQ